MKTWGITLAILTLLVIGGGCSSSVPAGSTALAPATDASGSGTRSASALAWGSPIVLSDQPPQYEQGKSLAIIGGNPAVTYVIWSDQGQEAGLTLYYQRANDPAGASWGNAKALAFWAYPGVYPCYSSLCEVNGKPAIAYQTYDGGLDYSDLRFIRAKDSAGNKWGAPLIVDPHDGSLGSVKGRSAIMKVVNGNPAIWYLDDDGGKYIRAINANGTSWGTPVYFDSHGGAGSFAVVNGHPAVILAKGANGELRYQRATDANGDTWGSPQIVLADPGPSNQKRLVVVDGYPAIAYSGRAVNPASSVRFIRALDADGTAWPSDSVAITESGDSTVEWLGWMDVINGLPSINFISAVNEAENSPPDPPQYGERSLNFIQALDSSGSAWETAQTIENLGRVDGRFSPLAEVGSGAGIAFVDEWHAMNYVGTLPAPPDPAVNVQLSTDKSSYIIGQDTEAVLTAVVTDEFGDPISGLGTAAFVTTLDDGSVVSAVTVTFSESATAGTYTGNLDISGLSTGDYTVQTTVTDPRDVSGFDSATFSMNEQGAGGTMHVGDLDASVQNGPHNRWRVTFTVMIGDSSHSPVSSADVAFSLSGDVSGSGQVTTGSDGTASYQTGWINGSGSVTFTVDDVTHATLTYSPGDNHDPDGDSDGTSITQMGP